MYEMNIVIRFRFIAAAVITALVIAFLAALLAVVIVQGSYDCPQEMEGAYIHAVLYM